MAIPLKEYFSTELYDRLAESLSRQLPDFPKQAFLNSIFSEDWKNLELKERSRHTTIILGNYLPDVYKDAIEVLKGMIQEWRDRGIEGHSIEYMFLPEFIEVFGLEQYEQSVLAMEEITQFFSCEFAVRPFFIRYQKDMCRQMSEWTTHPNHHVRRLASEGIRPRLPWAMALPAFKEDPSPILPILEQLKNDPSEYVRRSVANNLNDISKDHPEVVLEVCTRWKGLSPETDKLVKHACRTLLKAGNPAALALFGLGYNAGIQLQDLQLEQSSIQLGEYLHFTCTVSNQNPHPQIIRLEYAIYYQKANGSLSRKVFKISEKEYAPQDSIRIERRQHFKRISTRRYHSGLHQLSIILNGKEFPRHDFELHILP
ncbi:MAG: DNA alkylation repair protein [Bacteroidota bacterium]